MSKRTRSNSGVAQLAIPEEGDASCGVCLRVIEDPRVGDCACSQSFCGRCLEEWLVHNKTCPACAGPVSRTLPAARQWATLLDRLPRGCPNSSECKSKKADRAHMQRHALTECPYRVVPCPHEECRQLVQKKKLAQHVRLCRLKRCKNFRGKVDGVALGCTAMGTASEIKVHEHKCMVDKSAFAGKLLQQVDFLLRRVDEQK